MAAPATGYQATWSIYSTELGDAPKHTGNRYMYGPFVVAANTNIKDADFIPTGAATILGEGWTSPDVNLPDNFSWGVLTKTSDTTYALHYFTETAGAYANGGLNEGSRSTRLINFDRTEIPTPDGESATDFPPIDAATAPTAVTTFTDAKLTNKFAFMAEGIANGPGAPNVGESHFMITNHGGRFDAYEFTVAGNVFSVKRLFNGKNAATYYRVRDITTGTNDKGVDTGDKLADFARGGGGIYPASHTAALPSTDTGTDISEVSSGNIYFEQTWYGDDGKVYRTHSDRVPVNVLKGGGDITLNIQYWQGPTPLDKEVYPYEVRKLRFQTPSKANYGFWVG